MFITLFFCAAAYSEKDESVQTKGSLSEALQHLKVAKEKVDDANALLKHAEMSLKHLKAIDKQNRNKPNAIKVRDLPGAILNIEQAISHAEMGQTEFAEKYIKDALNDMH